MKIHVPNLVTDKFLLFTKSEFTADVQNILHESLHAWALLTDNGLPCPRAVANGLTGFINALLKLALNTPGLSKCLLYR